MRPQLYPWQLLSVIVAGILGNQQQRVIDYLKEENRALREQLGKALGRRVLSEICSIITPRYNHALAPRADCFQV